MLGNFLTDKRIGHRVLEPTGDGATDTAAFAAWLAASPRPPLSLSPTGQKLMLTTAPATVTSGDFRIYGNGVEIVQKYATAGSPTINLQRSMTTPQSTVSAIENQDHDISATSTNTLVTRVALTTASDVSLYPLDSYVLVSSEDVAPHGATSENPRMGQVLRVAKVDAGSGFIYFATTLWRADLYTTDIRVTLMPTGETVIDGVRFSIEAAAGEDIETRTSSAIVLANCLHPSITNCDIIESCSTGMALTRCVLGDISNNKVRKIRAFGGTGEGALTNGRLGYGILLQACDGLRVGFNQFANCRHGITDNWLNASASGAVNRHGPNMNCLLVGNISSFTKGAGLDWHSSSVNCQLVGNRSFGARADSSAGGYGYQVRGEGNVMIGNADYDCEDGIQVFENTADGTQDIKIIDHTSHAKKRSLVLSGSSSSTRKLTCSVIGGVFETRQVGAAAGKMIQVERAKVNFRGTVLRPYGQNGGDLVTVIGSGNADISGDVVYDPSRAAGTWALLSTTGTGNTFALRTRRDADDGAGADAAFVVTDTSSDVIVFPMTLTADRAVTFTCTGRKTVIIKRTASGAFNLNVTHSGGTLALAQDRGAVFEVHGALVMLVSPTITLA